MTGQGRPEVLLPVDSSSTVTSVSEFGVYYEAEVWRSRPASR